MNQLISQSMNSKHTYITPYIAGESALPRPTQPSIPTGSVNEYQLRLVRQSQVWFILLADVRGVCR